MHEFAAGRRAGLPLKQGGLGIANTLTSLVNVGLLLFALRNKLESWKWSRCAKRFCRWLLLALFAGADRVVRLAVLGKPIGHATIALKIGAVFVPAGIAGLVYWLTALALKIPAAKEMTEFALAKFKSRTGVAPVSIFN